MYGPEDLLKNAKYLLDTNDLRFMRPVILESMTALEVYIHTKIFKILELRFDPEFVAWLREKTKFNFNSRLGVITSLALGIKISKLKRSDLWTRYKKARNVRNDVSHEGRIISFNEAEEVYNTVYDWLACLGSNIGLEIALIEFKQFIENNHLSVTTEFEAQALVNDYFKESGVAKPVSNVEHLNSSRFDYILKFGNNTVALEFKLQGSIPEISTYIQDIIYRSLTLLNRFNIDKMAIMIFCRGPVPESYQAIKKFEAGEILVTLIQIE